MINPGELEKNLEAISESLQIEWQVPEEKKANLKKIVADIFSKQGKIWGAILRDRILLGDNNMVYAINSEIPFREFSAYPITDLPKDQRNSTKHQIYAALHQEPRSISSILNIDLSSEQEMALRKLILERIAKQIDAILG